MKKLIAMLAMGAVAVASHGDININWRAQAGFYKNGQFAVDPAGALLFGGGSTIAMLIWTPFNGGSPTIDPVDITDIAGNFSGGDDIVLDTLTITHPGNAGSQYADYANGPEIYLNTTYSTTLQGGYVFLRIFQDTTPNVGTFEYYFDGNPLLANAYTGSESPQALEGNTDNINGNELNKLIPEPSVLAFLGAGALVVAIRRMRKA